MDGRHVQGHDEAVLPVGGGIEGAAEQIQDQQRVLPEDGEGACPLLLLLIGRLLAGILHRADVLDEEGDEGGGAGDGDAADEEAEPQVVLEEQPRDGGREDQTQVAAQVHQRIGPLPVLCGGQVREERVIGRVFDALKDACDHKEEDGADPQGDRRADEKAEDADAVAGYDHPFFVEAVGQLAADEGGGQHDQARAHEEVGDLRRGEAQLPVEDHGHHGPDHAAQIGDDPAEEEDVDLTPQAAVLVQ